MAAGRLASVFVADKLGARFAGPAVAQHERLFSCTCVDITADGVGHIRPSVNVAYTFRLDHNPSAPPSRSSTTSSPTSNRGRKSPLALVGGPRAERNGDATRPRRLDQHLGNRRSPQGALDHVHRLVQATMQRAHVDVVLDP